MTIDERLEKARPFRVKADISHLGSGDRKALAECVEAAKIIDELYLDQIYSDNLRLLSDLKTKPEAEAEKFLRCFMIHGGPWDRWNNDEPFMEDVGPRPRGANFYPPDLTREELNGYLGNCGETNRKIIENPYTKVVRLSGGGLGGIFYNTIWKARLREIQERLENAAAHCSSEALKKFLRLRGRDLLTDGYEESEAAWIDVTESPIEITIGPYERYDDELLKTKTSYETAIIVRDNALSGAAKRYSDHIYEFDASLAKKYGYPVNGKKAPLIIGDCYFLSGLCAHHSFTMVAYNLPNDENIKIRYGSKKVFMKNLIEAKFDAFTFPVAERLMEKGVARRLTKEAFMLSMIGHEICHGVGPEVIVSADGRRTSVNSELRELDSLLEECKAECLGLAYLNYLADRNAIDRPVVRIAEIEMVTTVLRRFRWGAASDHSKGDRILYNWLKEKGAVAWDKAREKIFLEEEKLAGAYRALAETIIEIQSSGNYEKAKSFVEKWGWPSDEIKEAVSLIDDLPIDLELTFDALK